jgi:transposase-like protein
MGQEVISSIQESSMINFKNLTQLFDFFKDEDVCRHYFEKQRWGGNVACPFCGSLKVYRTTRGFKCGEKECYKKFSVTVGTVFENSKIPLRTWFAAMYLIASHKKGISSLQLHRDLGITQKTAWFILHRIREALREKNSPLLTDVVEVDETFVGGKNKNRHAHKKIDNSQGRSVKDKTPVVGVMQRGGKVVTQVVRDTKAENLHPLIVGAVKSGSIVITDEWRSYQGLDGMYHHVVIKHNEGEYVRGAFHNNTIEGFWSLLKRGLYGIYHQVSPKHLFRYCHEFEYRYNSRKIPDNERFQITLQRTEGRLKYKDLIGKGDGESKKDQEGEERKSA